MENVDHSLGLGPHLVGRQIAVRGRSLDIVKQLGEGGFSFVYLVRTRTAAAAVGGGGVNNFVGGGCGGDALDSDSNASPSSSSPLEGGGGSGGGRHRQMMSPSPMSVSSSSSSSGGHMVLKITSISNAAQQHMAEKEARLLRVLSHPSIVRVYDACTTNNVVNGDVKSSQHLILMEYCEGGTAFDAIRRMRSSSSSSSSSYRGTAAAASSSCAGGFDLPSLVIAFGQICNAVSYLHAQRPPVIHRDLKPVNFLIKAGGSYKLCDFGSAVVGHTDLRTPEERRRAEEVVSRTTTQMFRAPEMVDLYMTRRLTESTDVWALGCSLFSLAYRRDCFEEGSNLAILSRRYKVPDDNPYGTGLVDLIDRMLALDYRDRADMSEVIICLSALYSNRPLPDRRRRRSDRTRDEGEGGRGGEGEGEVVRMGGGSYRTDGQGIVRSQSPPTKPRKVVEAKKLNPNSAAAKRKKASEVVQRHNNDRDRTTSSWSSSSRAAPPLESRPSSVGVGDDDVFLDFASFDRGGFDGSFDHSHCDDVGSLSNCEAIEATLDASLSSALGEKFHISVAPSSRGAAGGSGAKSLAWPPSNDNDAKLSC
ncbi:hypothetical protein ACHAW5_011109 [Stephanodiscus triporus]|uniref:non-specific serine/threonine protein kinase n=1 Tax=Stephanodiscus triporus TaxID=2934178 RepID=A0ABD3MHL5_9STRA